MHVFTIVDVHSTQHSVQDLMRLDRPLKNTRARTHYEVIVRFCESEINRKGSLTVKSFGSECLWIAMAYSRMRPKDYQEEHGEESTDGT